MPTEMPELVQITPNSRSSHSGFSYPSWLADYGVTPQDWRTFTRGIDRATWLGKRQAAVVSVLSLGVDFLALQLGCINYLLMVNLPMILAYIHFRRRNVKIRVYDGTLPAWTAYWNKTFFGPKGLCVGFDLPGPLFENARVQPTQRTMWKRGTDRPPESTLCAAQQMRITIAKVRTPRPEAGRHPRVETRMSWYYQGMFVQLLPAAVDVDRLEVIDYLSDIEWRLNDKLLQKLEEKQRVIDELRAQNAAARLSRRPRPVRRPWYRRTPRFRKAKTKDVPENQKVVDIVQEEDVITVQEPDVNTVQEDGHEPQISAVTEEPVYSVHEGSHEAQPAIMVQEAVDAIDPVHGDDTTLDHGRYQETQPAGIIPGVAGLGRKPHHETQPTIIVEEADNLMRESDSVQPTTAEVPSELSLHTQADLLSLIPDSPPMQGLSAPSIYGPGNPSATTLDDANSIISIVVPTVFNDATSSTSTLVPPSHLTRDERRARELRAQAIAAEVSEYIMSSQGRRSQRGQGRSGSYSQLQSVREGAVLPSTDVTPFTPKPTQRERDVASLRSRNSSARSVRSVGSGRSRGVEKRNMPMRFLKKGVARLHALYEY